MALSPGRDIFLPRERLAPRVYVLRRKAAVYVRRLVVAGRRRCFDEADARFLRRCLCAASGGAAPGEFLRTEGTLSPRGSSPEVA